MSKRLIRLFWILAVLAAPLPLLHAYFAGNWYAFTHPYSLGMALGVISFTWLVIVLILSARVRLFDRLYGHDRVLVFHGLLAGTAIVAGIAHSRIKEYYMGDSALQAQLGQAAMAVFILGAVMAHLVMSGHMARRLPFTTPFIRWIRRIRLFDYSRIKLLHNIMAFCLIVIIIHILIAAPTRETALRRWVMGGWGGFGILFYLYHKVIKQIILRSRKQEVLSVEQPGPGITRLSFSTPLGKGGGRGEPGQFAYLRVLSKETGHEEHPFTISAYPEAGPISITVKDLGDYSGRLDRVRAGDRVLLDGPYGVFTPERNAGPHLFVAGGIGITPFLSVLQDWEPAGLDHPVILIWSVREREEIIDHEFLDMLDVSQEKFRFIPVITGGEEGRRLDREQLAEILKDSPVKELTAWICGPDRMKKTVVKDLKKIGVRRSRIRFERFSG